MTRRAVVEELLAKLRSMAAEIGASEASLPVSSQPGEGTWIEADGDPLIYRLLYTDRGEIRLLLETSREAELLERAMRAAASAEATKFELANRKAGEDSRRQWFALTAELLGKLDPAWKERELLRQAEILNAHPFDEPPSPWQDHLPPARGRLVKGERLAPYTWFRVGGPVDVLFLPADAEDLRTFVLALHHTVPVTVIGVGSNLLVRDGGVEGVAIRLGRPFANIEARPQGRLYAGAAALDAQVAKAAAEAGIAGLEFFSGIPGTIGGACVMNAGCYGRETKDVLVEAYAINPWSGEEITLSNADMKFSYRKSHPGPNGRVLGGLIFTGALFEGTPDDPAAVKARMAEITARRETTQPIREKTGGSTFKNPPGHSSWKLVDEAGWRGKLFSVTGGGAMFSPLHSNFMINPGEATAADLEGLGDAVRADVLAKTGVQLDWEIKRIGRPLPAKE